MLNDPPHTEDCQHGKPDHHHGAYQPADARRALPLDGEKGREDHHHRGQDVALQMRRDDRQSLQRRQHRYRRRYDEVPIDQRRTREADEYDESSPFALHAQQRRQGENAAFAVVIHTHGEHDVFQRGDDDQRPDDQRQRAEDFRRRLTRSDIEHGLHCVERAGADVAKHDTEGSQAQCRHAVCVDCVGRFGRLGRHRLPPADAPLGDRLALRILPRRMRVRVLFARVVAVSIG